MKYFKDFKSLCTPASIYLFINVIIFVSIAVQNFGNTTKYCVGQYRCQVPNTFSMFLFKALYILFWTFVLNAICKAGYKEVSWFMVLLPIILLFIIIGMVILNSGSVYEGFVEGSNEEEEEEEENEGGPAMTPNGWDTPSPGMVPAHVVASPGMVSAVESSLLKNRLTQDQLTSPY